MHRAGCFPCPGLPTCPDVRLAEQPGQAPHAVEGVEVVHILVQPVHPILVLQAGTHNVVWRCLLAWPQSKPSCAGVCAHRQQVPGSGERVGMGELPVPVMMVSSGPSQSAHRKPAAPSGVRGCLYLGQAGQDAGAAGGAAADGGEGVLEDHAAPSQRVQVGCLDG